MIWEPPFAADSVASEIDPANFGIMATDLLDDAFVPLLTPVEWASGWDQGGWRNPNVIPFAMGHYIPSGN